MNIPLEIGFKMKTSSKTGDMKYSIPSSVLMVRTVSFSVGKLRFMIFYDENNTSAQRDTRWKYGNSKNYS